MSDIWIISIPILLVDVASPVLLAAVAFTLTGNRPVANCLVLILGHTIAYLAFGILIIYGLAEFISPVTNFIVNGFINPTRINFIIGLLLGIVLVALAFKVSTSAAMAQQLDRSKTHQKNDGVWPTFVMGATICVVGIPFAVPYFGFINEMYRFNVQSKMLGLLIYNLLYALPFLIIPLAYSFWGHSIFERLRSLNQFIGSTASWLVPLLFAVLGFAFIADAIKYFITGSGLI